MSSNSTKLGPRVRDVVLPWEQKSGKRENRIARGGLHQPSPPFKIDSKLGADILGDVLSYAAAFRAQQKLQEKLKEPPSKKPTVRIVGFHAPPLRSKK